MTSETTGAAELPGTLHPIQRFEVVDCIDSKHVPAVIPNKAGPWVRYEDHAAQVEALSAAQAGVPSDAMVDAYLQAQRRAVEDADQFRRPNIGGLHSNTVREACRAGLKAALAAAPQPSSAPAPAEPIDMVLHCPKCGLQHIDEPEPELGPNFDGSGDALLWPNPPHRSHLCHGCGHIWRPADVPTNGVKAVKTKGKADSPIAAPAPAQPGQEGEPVLDTAATIASLQKRAAHLEKQLAKARAAPQPATADAVDAARYRHIRSRDNSLETQQRDKGITNGPSCYHEVDGIRELKWGVELDAAIDAARAAQREAKL